MCELEDVSERKKGDETYRVTEETEPFFHLGDGFFARYMAGAFPGLEDAESRLCRVEEVDGILP